MNFNLTEQQARRAATSIAARIYDMDSGRPKDWYTMPTDCNLTKSDICYRAELLEAYDAIMAQMPKR